MEALDALTDEPLSEASRKTALDLIHKEKLYEDAIEMCGKKKGMESLQEEVKLTYADYLFKIVKNTKAAAYIYERCGAYHQALEAYKVRSFHSENTICLRDGALQPQSRPFRGRDLLYCRAGSL